MMGFTALMMTSEDYPGLVQDSRQRFSVDRAGAGYRQAVVTCQYKRKHYSEVSSSFTLDSLRVFLL